jgi:hypothetical protein
VVGERGGIFGEFIMGCSLFDEWVFKKEKGGSSEEDPPSKD